MVVTVGDSCAVLGDGCGDGAVGGDGCRLRGGCDSAAMRAL
ncbi:MAG: hypothetical protein OXU71_07830 [Gammaproteobacteria bacterium]|nr:hypothetical protein [Gammaproteobacteria bacterium]